MASDEGVETRRDCIAGSRPMPSIRGAKSRSALTTDAMLAQPCAMALELGDNLAAHGLLPPFVASVIDATQVLAEAPQSLEVAQALTLLRPSSLGRLLRVRSPRLGSSGGPRLRGRLWPRLVRFARRGHACALVLRSGNRREPHGGHRYRRRDAEAEAEARCEGARRLMHDARGYSRIRPKGRPDADAQLFFDSFRLTDQ